MPRPPLRVFSALALAVASLASVSVLTAEPAGAAVLPPSNPADNPPPANLLRDCYPPVNASACSADAVAAIDTARAREGVGPMVLPSNFASLGAPEQFLVVIDLERVDRGEAPVAGVTANLDAEALVGAQDDADPPLPGGAAESASLWIGSWSNPLYDDFFWMYDDGPGGANGACTASNGTGCWAHRDAILTQWPAGSLLMGAAVAATRSYGASAGVVVASGLGQPAVFTWAQEQPYLEIGVSPGNIDLGAQPGTTAQAPVTVASSGQPASVTLSVSGGSGQFSVSPASCSVAAGQVCAASVRFSPQSRASVDAVLNVSGPGGVHQVPLHGGPFNGYWLAASDGGVFSFGTSAFYGSTGGVRLNSPVVGMASTTDQGGYWMVASDGGVFSFGDARFQGSTGGVRLNAPVVGMAADPATGGYWLVASDGGVFSFGAPFLGSTGGVRLDQPIVGITATADGRGYWLVGRDGGVFSFGDARFQGSTGGQRLNAPVVGMAADPATGGYWLVASDGGVFSFAAPFLGSVGGRSINAPVVGMAAAPGGTGYWLVGRDGGIYSFGGASFLGSTGNVTLNQPVVGMTY